MIAGLKPDSILFSIRLTPFSVFPFSIISTPRLKLRGKGFENFFIHRKTHFLRLMVIGKPYFWHYPVIYFPGLKIANNLQSKLFEVSKKQ